MDVLGQELLKCFCGLDKESKPRQQQNSKSITQISQYYPTFELLESRSISRKIRNWFWFWILNFKCCTLCLGCVEDNLDLDLDLNLNFKCCPLCLGCVVDDNETGAHLELSSKLFIMNLAIATTRKQPICLVKQRYSKITTYVLVGVGTTTRMCKTYQIMAKKLG